MQSTQPYLQLAGLLNYLIMLYTDPWPIVRQFSLKPRLGTVYILLLLVSLSLISVQSRSLNHQIDNRSPEIDPYWYVGRGVRPIGRFGKRQLKNRSNLQPHFSPLFQLVLSHLKKQDGLHLDNDIESW
ncbi:prolactin-releasing peptide-like [Mixophyes fleayi]|uniref:prolactin-releasing peptide-like n=1 Tax=Mixophyes fleayi TaxID=3061075 RepID=UPI003F4DA79C